MISYLKTIIPLSIIFIATIFIVCPVQGFVADHIEYNIQQNGDATVTADYTMSLGEQIALMVPTVKEQFTEVIKSEFGQDATVVSMSNKRATFTIPKYADATDTYIQTPCMDFNRIKDRAESYWFMKYMDIDYSPTLTTISFPNGEVITYNDMLFIPATTSNL
jgi:hypothetical protein